MKFKFLLLMTSTRGVKGDVAEVDISDVYALDRAGIIDASEVAELTRKKPNIQHLRNLKAKEKTNNG